jgi:hypothetical protein
MSERGLFLALQRLHDDPGFVNLVAADPQNTLGIYDLDEEECQQLIQAATHHDEDTLRAMASRVGIDWTANQIQGTGALSSSEVSLEGQPARSVDGPLDTKVAPLGDNWNVGQTQQIGHPHDLAEGSHGDTRARP